MSDLPPVLPFSATSSEATAQHPNADADKFLNEIVLQSANRWTNRSDDEPISNELIRKRLPISTVALPRDVCCSHCGNSSTVCRCASGYKALKSVVNATSKEASNTDVSAISESVTVSDGALNPASGGVAPSTMPGLDLPPVISNDPSGSEPEDLGVLQLPQYPAGEQRRVVFLEQPRIDASITLQSEDDELGEQSHTGTDSIISEEQTNPPEAVSSDESFRVHEILERFHMKKIQSPWQATCDTASNNILSAQLIYFTGLLFDKVSQMEVDMQKILDSETQYVDYMSLCTDTMRVIQDSQARTESALQSFASQQTLMMNKIDNLSLELKRTTSDVSATPIGNVDRNFASGSSKEAYRMPLLDKKVSHITAAANRSDPVSPPMFYEITKLIIAIEGTEDDYMKWCISTFPPSAASYLKQSYARLHNDFFHIECNPFYKWCVESFDKKIAREEGKDSIPVRPLSLLSTKTSAPEKQQKVNTSRDCVEAFREIQAAQAEKAGRVPLSKDPAPNTSTIRKKKTLSESLKRMAPTSKDC